MKVHIMKPYAIDKNLGRAYNEAMQMIPDGDWACLMDYDTMFLTPDCGKILHDYAEQFSAYYERYSNLGLVPYPLMTCYTNRIGHPDQLLDPLSLGSDNILPHIEIANNLKKNLYRVTSLNCCISGFLMLISKSTWNSIKFSEDKKCLGVDNDYSARILASGREILRMDGLYVWHTYRLANGIKDKTHLL